MNRKGTLKHHKKHAMDVIFNAKILSYLLAVRRNPFGKRKKSACSKSSSCRFSFSAARNAITKATEYVPLGFSFRVLVFFPL